jgi:hypothetical protein
MSEGTRATDDDLSPRALYLLMQQRFQDNSTAVLAALTAQKEAVQKAEDSATARFDEFKREISTKLDLLMAARDAGTGGGIARREIIAYGINILMLVALVWTATHKP